MFGTLLALLANIKLGSEIMAVANTQAYYDMATTRAVKTLIAQAPGLIRRNNCTTFHLLALSVIIRPNFKGFSGTKAAVFCPFNSDEE